MESPDQSTVHFRSPTLADAAAIWALVRDTGVLDVNSSYLYLLLCRDFSETCVVAESNGRIVGVVTAYRVPHCPSRLFVWQVAVSQAARRNGLGLKMLLSIFQRLHGRATERGATEHGSIPDGGIQSIEATVAASNTASRRLFQRLATELGGQLNQQACFHGDLFPPGGHEDEPLLTITPSHAGWRSPVPAVDANLSTSDF